MSGSQEIITRRPRGERQQDDGGGQQAAPSVTIERPEEISPEDALAESRRQLQASQQQTADARRQAREAQQIAQRASAQAQEATTARVSDREVAVTSVLDGAKAEVTAAKAAYRAAREAGDVDAEIAAQELLASATMRAGAATAELDRIKAAPKPQPQAQPNQQGGPSPEAQAWLDAHPAYNTDRKYKAIANEAHNEALRAGHRDGSQSYVDFIDGVMTEEFGDGHGQVGDQQVQQPRGGRQQQQSARANGGDGLPPSRGGGGSQGGYKTLDTPLGAVQFRQGRDGKIESIKFASASTADNFREGAETSFRRLYETNPDQALADFATETIQEYLEGGETIRSGDGRILR